MNDQNPLLAVVESLRAEVRSLGARVGELEAQLAGLGGGLALGGVDRRAGNVGTIEDLDVGVLHLRRDVGVVEPVHDGAIGVLLGAGVLLEELVVDGDLIEGAGKRRVDLVGRDLPGGIVQNLGVR